MKLLRISTGEKVEARIEQLSAQEVKQLKGSESFLFDWSIEVEKEVYRITLIESPHLLGLMSLVDIPEELRIHINLIESSIDNQGIKKQYDYIPGCLIAFACRKAFEKGYDGFVSLIPKTQLINYYHKKYGFFPMGTHMAIFGASAQEIILKYLQHETI